MNQGKHDEPISSNAIRVRHADRAVLSAEGRACSADACRSTGAQRRDPRDGVGVSAGGMSHTPGPWTATPDAHAVYGNATDAARHICTITMAINPNAEDASNARLIAAAPDLLVALKALLPVYRDAVKLHDPNTDDVLSARAHNAIAKAEAL
jgi:hypothetical protein